MLKREDKNSEEDLVVGDEGNSGSKKTFYITVESSRRSVLKIIVVYIEVLVLQYMIRAPLNYQ